MTIYELLQQKVDIVEYIGQDSDLTSFGDGSWRGKCCIHHGDNPTSLMVTPKNNTFYCNSCGAGGSVINYVQYRERCNYNEAVEILADYANIDLSKDEEYKKQRNIFQRNEATVQKYKKHIDNCIEYLVKRRGLTPETIDAFDLGWQEDDKAIVIPIRDHQGRTMAFSRRFLYSEPKYKNSRNSEVYDKGKTLFNMDKARRMIKDRLYIVEGYIDAISGHQQGQPTVAYCTSELSKDQIVLIKEIIQNNPNITIYLGPDNDEIGEQKLIKMREKFLQIAPKLNVRVLKYPGLHWSQVKEGDEDNSEYFKDFNDLIKAGYDITELPSEQLEIHVLKIKLDKCKDEQEQYLVTEQFCKTVQNAMIKADIAIMLSIRWNKSVKEIKDWLDVSVQTDEDMVAMFKGVDQCLQEYKTIIETEGTTIGYAEIDASLRGLRASDVMIFGAYSSVGKTFYAVEFAKHMAIRLKKNVLIFSLEMPAGALMERLIANIMGVSTEQLEQMIKTSNKWLDVYDNVRTKLEEKIKIVDKNNISIEDIDRMIKIANARMIWKEGKTDVVIVDYFQYMKNTHDFESASASARGMKAVAKDNEVLLIMLSQLSRNGSPWEKPTMQMLKSTGDLEASADIILMAYRPGLDPDLSKLDAERMRDIIMVTIAKARRGVVATDFEHVFNKTETRIRETRDFGNRV